MTLPPPPVALAKRMTMFSAAGREFELPAPRPEQVVAEDVANALANLCRYGGHVRQFYSVAQHSVLVAQCAADLAQAAGANPRLRRTAYLLGLLHDAAEAFLGDVTWPLKHQEGMAWYRLQELAVEKVVISALWAEDGRHAVGSPMFHHAGDLVNLADRAVCLAEGRDLTHGEAWLRERIGAGLVPFPDEHIRALAPADARALFLNAYRVATL